MPSKFAKPNPLAHLSGEQIEDLMRAYYGGERAEALLSRFAVDIGPSALVAAFPPEVLTDRPCPYCATPLVVARASRTGKTKPTPNCPNCGHKDHHSCRCEPCAVAARRLEAERVRRGRLQLRAYADPLLSDPVSLSYLPLDERLFLGALLRANPGDDVGRIEPFPSITDLVAPSKALFDEYVERLKKRRALVIDPGSPIEAFIFDDSGWRYYPAKVCWLPNVSGTTERDALVELMQPEPCSSIEDADAAVALWRRLAVEESLEYLRLKSGEHRLDLEITDKHRHVLSLVIERYSTAQAYNFIWRAVREAAADLQARKKVKAHALNSIAVRIQGFADRAAASATPVRPFGREFKLPLSVMTSLLYDCVLGVGADGFSSVPRRVRANDGSES